VVSVFLYLLQFPSYDVINDVIMSDVDCTPGREPRSVATTYLVFSETLYVPFRILKACNQINSFFSFTSNISS